MTTGFGPLKTHYGNHEESCVGNINSKMYIVLQQQRSKYATQLEQHTDYGCLHNCYPSSSDKELHLNGHGMQPSCHLHAVTIKVS